MLDFGPASDDLILVCSVGLLVCAGSGRGFLYEHFKVVGRGCRDYLDAGHLRSGRFEFYLEMRGLGAGQNEIVGARVGPGKVQTVVEQGLLEVNGKGFIRRPCGCDDKAYAEMHAGSALAVYSFHFWQSLNVIIGFLYYTEGVEKRVSKNRENKMWLDGAG